jgi:hypothetical protein
MTMHRMPSCLGVATQQCSKNDYVFPIGSPASSDVREINLTPKPGKSIKRMDNLEIHRIVARGYDAQVKSFVKINYASITTQTSARLFDNFAQMRRVRLGVP